MWIEGRGAGRTGQLESRKEPRMAASMAGTRGCTVARSIFCASSEKHSQAASRNSWLLARACLE